MPVLLFGLSAIGYGVWAQFRDAEVNWAWLGAILAIAPLVSFLLSLAVLKRARTNRNQYVILGAAVVGTTMSLVHFEMPASLLAVVLGAIPAFLYVYWYSVLDRTGSKIAVGGKLAELELVDTAGNPVRPTPGKHGLYMFVRGNWCPLCMAQVKEVAAQYRELEARGVEVFLISPQPARQTGKLADRFDVPIRFCVDEDNATARKLGIEHENGLPFMMEALGYESDSVLPTVIMVDPERTIVFADLTDNYRVRPEPSTFLAVLER